MPANPHGFEIEITIRVTSGNMLRQHSRPWFVHFGSILSPFCAGDSRGPDKIEKCVTIKITAMNSTFLILFYQCSILLWVEALFKKTYPKIHPCLATSPAMLTGWSPTSRRKCWAKLCACNRDWNRLNIWIDNGWTCNDLELFPHRSSCLHWF